MQPPAPIIVTTLFPEVLDELLTLLSGLTAEEWELPTNDPGWTGKDTAWRLFTKGISADAAQAKATISGDQRLGLKVLAMVSVIA